MQADRLRSSLSFSEVFEEGCTVVGRFVVLHYLPSGRSRPRVGFAAGKKLGGAVLRNRLRRVLKEAFRHLQGELLPADVVLVARRRMSQAAFSEIQDDLSRLLSRAGLLQSEASNSTSD